jgi:PAS domain S-box-containing protein
MSTVSPFHPELIDLLPSALYVCDNDSRLVQHNQRAVEIWGGAPEQDMLESDFYSRFQLLNSNGAAVFTPPLTQVLTHKQPRKNWDVVLERGDGQHFALLFNAALLKDDAGNLAGAVGLFQEISDLKRAEEAVRVAQRIAAASRSASGVAQQLTDPLATIARSLAELQEDSTLSLTARHYAAIVQQELNRLGTIAHRALAPYGVRA